MKETEEKNDGLTLEDYGVLFLTHWHWFVVSVLIALGIGTYHLMRTTPIYTRTTQLLIRDESDDAKGGSAFQELKNVGVIGSTSNIRNEMLTISAPILMQETVKRLHLDLQMEVEEGLHMHPLYNDAPLQLDFTGTAGDDYGFSFTMTPIARNKVRLSDFKVMGEEAGDGKTITAAVGSIVNTPVGKVQVKPSPSWNDNFIGREIFVSKYPVRAIGNLYAGRLGVDLSDKEATVLDLSLADEVPERASDVLLTLIEVYNENWVKEKNRMAESTSEFIAERLENLSKELDNVDEQISDYKSKNLLPDVEATVAQNMQQSGKNFDSMLQLHNQLSMAQFLRERLDDKSKDNQLLPTNIGLSSTGIDALIVEYNKLMLDRNSYVENSNENAPIVKDLDRRLSSQKLAIMRSVDNLVEQLQKQIANVESTESNINRSIASNPMQAKVLNAVQRQQKVKEALYIYLLQKREENELSRTYTAWNTSVIQPPIGSSSPTAPRSKMILLVAFLLGIAVPGGILILRDTMNHKVRGRRDLDEIDVPLIGEVPDVSAKKHWWEKKSKVRRSIIVRGDGKDLINEAMRIVRTNLDYFVANNENGRVVMFTSFNPGSGKSFISSNLAATMAFKGKRVVAIDLDLRHASLSHMVPGSHRRIGISSYLSGHTDNADELILRDALVPGLDILPVGTLPPNPTELLLSDRLEKLLNTLKQEYDYVFLDCPPIEVVADATIVKKFADISIFVVRAGLMDRRGLSEVEKRYKEKSFNNLTILLNGTKYISSRYGANKYGYSYGYSYGNSYYNEE